MNKLEKQMYDAIQAVPLINFESDDYEGYAKACAKIAIELMKDSWQSGSDSWEYNTRYELEQVHSIEEYLETKLK